LATCEAGGYRVERAGDFAFAAAEKTYDGCTTCRGTGLISRDTVDHGRTYEVSAPCERRLLSDRLALFNTAQIPAIHGQATFDAYKPATQEQAQALKKAREFVQLWPAARGLVLAGPVGTGKTHLLAAILKHLCVERGVRASYVEISLLYSTIRRGFQEGKSGGEIIGPLSKIELLAIDELGKGRGSPFELETLDELIARRYNAGKVTLFATNFSLRAPEEKAMGMIQTSDLKDAGKESRLLCDRVGDRIYSRLCELCDFIEFPPGTPDKRRARLAAELRR
jgi:DNA replication protein DnaC